MSFYDRRVRARVSSKYRRTGQQGGTQIFSKSGGTIDAKSLGLRRLWDSIAPPLHIKTLKFYPRQGDFACPTGTYTNAAITPVLQAGAAEQKFDQFHLLSTAEWITLARKVADNTLLSTSNETISTPATQTTLSDLNRNLMLEHYKQRFTFENCQTWGCWVEIIEVRPRRPIVDQVSTSGVSVFGTLTSTSDPLSCIYKDHEANRSFSNALAPIDTSFNDNKTQAEKRIGYTVLPTGRCFNRNYLILKRKKLLIPPGGRVVYDVVIPGFKAFSDFIPESVEVLPVGGGGSLNISPSLWEKSRTLMIRHWSDNVSATGAAKSEYTCLGDTRLKVICDKDVRIRAIPSISKPTNFSEGGDGVDAYGRMSALQDLQTGVADADVRFINVESEAVGFGGYV